MKVDVLINLLLVILCLSYYVIHNLILCDLLNPSGEMISTFRLLVHRFMHLDLLMYQM